APLPEVAAASPLPSATVRGIRGRPRAESRTKGKVAPCDSSVTSSHRRPRTRRWLAPVQRHLKVVVNGARRRARLLPPEKSLCLRGPTGSPQFHITRMRASGRRAGEEPAVPALAFVSDEAGRPFARTRPFEEFKQAKECQPNPVSLGAEVASS